MSRFAATIEGWSEKAKRNTLLVVKQSIQDVFEDAQLPRAKGGRMRVDTGFLRNSLIASLSGSTSLTGPESYIPMVDKMKAGDTFFGGWTAVYAEAREFGAKGQMPDFFMRGAAMKWESIVAANAAKLKD